MSRATAIKLVREHDGRFPNSYLGCSLEKVLNEMDMSHDEFERICDSFTNKKLFMCDGSGKLIKDRFGNLTKVNYDNP
jgi:hypothetical protein